MLIKIFSYVYVTFNFPNTFFNIPLVHFNFFYSLLQSFHFHMSTLFIQHTYKDIPILSLSLSLFSQILRLFLFTPISTLHLHSHLYLCQFMSFLYFLLLFFILFVAACFNYLSLFAFFPHSDLHSTINYNLFLFHLNNYILTTFTCFTPT